RLALPSSSAFSRLAAAAAWFTGGIARQTQSPSPVRANAGRPVQATTLANCRRRQRFDGAPDPDPR
uniref:Uncharacterized protein n=1 Tax=Aegilops tauschii subsp. strangulata TaxID=200361 RepID=A0A453T2F4_AEGTS